MARRKEPAISAAILDQLLAGADAKTAFDQGGLLDSLKKALTERALNAEMDHHLDGEGGFGNGRNGYGRKTVTTETGKLELEIPRDRQSSFDPQLIAKYQRRFPGFDDKIISTTNAIEALNSKLRRAVRARGHFPTDEAAIKLLFLVLNRSEKEWIMPPREWSMAKAQFAVLFGERFTRAAA
jgi:transposase-like protein